MVAYVIPVGEAPSLKDLRRFPDGGDRVLDPGVGEQRAFDLAELHAVAADLHLAVAAAHVPDVAAGQRDGEVVAASSAVSTTTGVRAVAGCAVGSRYTS